VAYQFSELLIWFVIFLLRNRHFDEIFCSDLMLVRMFLYISFIHSSMALQLLVGPWPLLQLPIFFTQTIGLLGRVISPSQGRYLPRGQHKYRINAHTDVYALSGIRAHDPSFRAREHSLCSRPRGHCDRLENILQANNIKKMFWLFIRWVPCKVDHYHHGMNRLRAAKEMEGLWVWRVARNIMNM
jgi:hypothetical protein